MRQIIRFFPVVLFTTLLIYWAINWRSSSKKQYRSVLSFVVTRVDTQINNRLYLFGEDGRINLIGYDMTVGDNILVGDSFYKKANREELYQFRIANGAYRFIRMFKD